MKNLLVIGANGKVGRSKSIGFAWNCEAMQASSM